MRRYLLDTNAMGDFINRRRGVDERARDARKSELLFNANPILPNRAFGPEFAILSWSLGLHDSQLGGKS